MSMQITWSVERLFTVNDVYQNVVHMAMVILEVQQDGMIATQKEPFVFERPTGDFTPYDQLTESQVLQWVFDMLTPAGVKQREDGLIENIQIQLNPAPVPVSQPLPWAAG